MINIDEMEAKFDQLMLLGAGDFEHWNGSLINHLKGTYALLKSWGTQPALCIAGLYHAVYGTSGFDEVMVSDSHREKIKKIIGEQSENIVYTYCACDRDLFWPQIGNDANPLFLDRFTGQKYHLSFQELKWFCELTVANELEIANDNNEFIKKYGPSLKPLFLRMKPYISKQAVSHVDIIFGDR